MQADLYGYVFTVSNQTRKQWRTSKSSWRDEESCPGHECQGTHSPATQRRRQLLRTLLEEGAQYQMREYEE